MPPLIAPPIDEEVSDGDEQLGGEEFDIDADDDDEVENPLANVAKGTNDETAKRYRRCVTLYADLVLCFSHIFTCSHLEHFQAWTKAEKLLQAGEKLFSKTPPQDAPALIVRYINSQ